MNSAQRHHKSCHVTQHVMSWTSHGFLLAHLAGGNSRSRNKSFESFRQADDIQGRQLALMATAAGRSTDAVLEWMRFLSSEEKFGNVFLLCEGRLWNDNGCCSEQFARNLVTWYLVSCLALLACCYITSLSSLHRHIKRGLE